MTTTDPRPTAPATPHRTAPSRASALSLAAGSLLSAAALSLHLRGGAPDVAFVRRIEAAPDVWLAAHVLMAVGGILLLLGLLTVPRLATGRGRRAVAIGAALSALGAVSTALGDFAHGTLAYVLVGDMTSEQSHQLQDQFFAQPLLAAVSMPGLLLPLGMLVLGGALLYSHAVPVPAAVLVLIGPVAVQLGYLLTALPMPVMVLPMVAGLGWVSFILAGGPRPAANEVGQSSRREHDGIRMRRPSRR